MSRTQAIKRHSGTRRRIIIGGFHKSNTAQAWDKCAAFARMNQRETSMPRPFMKERLRLKAKTYAKLRGYAETESRVSLVFNRMTSCKGIKPDTRVNSGVLHDKRNRIVD
jgi:hypothetical protein